MWFLKKSRRGLHRPYGSVSIPIRSSQRVKGGLERLFDMLVQGRPILVSIIFYRTLQDSN